MIVRILNVPGKRELIVYAPKARKHLVPVLHTRIVYKSIDQADSRTEHRRIKYRRKRQTIQPKCKGKNQHKGGKQQESVVFA